MIKINRKDIRRIIEILEAKETELGEHDEFIVYDDEELLKSDNSKLISPIPEKWYLNKLNDHYRKSIIFEWMQRQIDGNHWKFDYPDEWHLHSQHRQGLGKPTGYTNPQPGFTEISFEFFYEYIVK